MGAVDVPIMNVNQAEWSRDIREALKKRFNLSYHIEYLSEAQRRCGLAGMKVLEVGGSLPRELVIDDLGAQQWFGVEEMSYWEELTPNGGGTQPRQRDCPDVGKLGALLPNNVFSVVNGKVEDLDPDVVGYFDRVFSIACFEHIHTLGLALERMYQALKPGGLVFSMFSPLWSSPDGHHLPRVSDASGKVFDFHNAPIPPWGHLLMRPAEMYEMLQSHTDEQTAAHIVYQVYHSPHINRLFTDDYIRYFQRSKFAIKELILTFPSRLPRELESKLKAVHPHNRHFSNNGILVVLQKP